MGKKLLLVGSLSTVYALMSLLLIPNLIFASGGDNNGINDANPKRAVLDFVSPTVIKQRGITTILGFVVRKYCDILVKIDGIPLSSKPGNVRSLIENKIESRTENIPTDVYYKSYSDATLSFGDRFASMLETSSGYTCMGNIYILVLTCNSEKINNTCKTEIYPLNFNVLLIRKYW